MMGVYMTTFMAYFTTIVAAMGMYMAASCSPEKEPEHNSRIPQAEPVVNQLLAAKKSDPELLKSVFSKEVIRRIESLDREWPEVLRMYSDLWSETFGDYDVDNFYYRFEGDESKGTVHITYKVELPGLNVVKEESGWKINER